MKKKRHHYVPKAYLKFFCDEDGKVRVYLKDEPDKIIHQAPDNTAFHKYYYSQPLPEGGKDHNRLEAYFSEFESDWPGLVGEVRRRADVNSRFDDIVSFIALQRARVPASRDAFEAMSAEMVKVTIRLLDAQGKLPPKPKGLEDTLDHVEVSIDPHRSLHAMTAAIAGIGQVICAYGEWASRSFIPDRA